MKHSQPYVILAAAAIANTRGGRRGMPQITNVLELLPSNLLEEVTEDAEAVLEAVGFDELFDALVESVKLQSHYAQLLNAHDGGQRLSFESAEAWLARLREVVKRTPHPRIPST